MSDLNDTTPIEQAAAALGLDPACLSLPAVRTLGDLRVVLERGEVEKGLARSVRAAIGGYPTSDMPEYWQQEPALRVGVTFTEEQQAQIEEVVRLEKHKKA